MLNASCFFFHHLREAVYALLLVTICSGVQAELYRWVDENGQVNYGDCPPADCNSQSVPIPSPPSKEEVEQAHQRLERYQEMIESLRNSKKTIPLIATSPVELLHQEIHCFDPLEKLISGPSGEMFTPITPTILKKKQQQELIRLLHRLDKNWRKGRADITICEDTPEQGMYITQYTDDDARVEIDTNSSDNQLQLKLKWQDQKQNIGRRYILSLAVGDRFYISKYSYFQNIEQTGNSVEIVHLDKHSILFLIKPRVRIRKGSLPYPEVRYLAVYDNKWILTELRYANNRLQERIDWIFGKSLN